MAKFTVLSKTFEGEPAAIVPDVLAAVAAGLDDAVGKSASAEEKVEKLMKVINEEFKPAVAAIQEEQRTLARNAPPPDDSEKPLKFGKLNLRMEPTRQETADGEFGPAYSSLARGQMSLLVQDMDSLGIDDERTRKVLGRFRFLHDKLTLLHARYVGDSNLRQNYRGWDSLPDAAEYKALAKKFQGTSALSDSSSGVGTEFVPGAILSAGIFDRMENFGQLAPALTTFPMAGPIVDRSGRGTRATSYHVAEEYTGFSGGTANTDTPADSTKATFTAKKQVVLAAVSEEWTQDSIMGPGGVMDELAYAMAYDRENALINGQYSTYGTLTAQTGNLDTGVTIAANNMRLMVKGVRQLFADSTVTAQDMSAGVDASNLAGCWASQGPFGNQRDGLWIVETSGLARIMTASNKDSSPLFMTAAAAGPDAVNIKGVLGSCMGRPIILSDLVPITLNSSGIIPSPVGALTEILHLNRRAVEIGERRGVVVTFSEHARFQYGQGAYRAMSRWDFEPLYSPSTTNKIIGAGFGVATF